MYLRQNFRVTLHYIFSVRNPSPVFASTFENQILKMKAFFICGLLFTLFVCFVYGSTDEERRFREGNSFSRKLKACNLVCSLKGSLGSYNQTRCYKFQNENVVVTDCVYKCLRRKLGKVLIFLKFINYLDIVIQWNMCFISNELLI